MAIDTLHSQGLRFVESHICQNRADMGHPGFVADRAPEKSRLMMKQAQRIHKRYSFGERTKSRVGLHRRSVHGTPWHPSMIIDISAAN